MKRPNKAMLIISSFSSVAVWLLIHDDDNNNQFILNENVMCWQTVMGRHNTSSLRLTIKTNRGYNDKEHLLMKGHLGPKWKYLYGVLSKYFVDGL